ncbi:MAG: NAD(P)/FAD-dependent oxidoreductase [archaeon]
MISVVGGGPAGLFSAALLARQGRNIVLYEEHKTIGQPIQCTGILTRDIDTLIRLKPQTIANRIKRIRVVSPSGKDVIIRLKRPEYITYRDRLDQQIADIAEKEGVTIKTGHRLVKATNTAVTMRHDGRTTRTPTDMIIGADGPLSAVARLRGMVRGKKHFIGQQYVVKGDFDPDTYTAYLGRDIPGFFGWLVPENEERARIGIAASKDASAIMARFCRRALGEGYKKQIKECQAGVIPLYDPKATIQQGRTFLVGDAATQAKATTGGGIIPGLKAARALSRSIKKGTPYRTELIGLDRQLTAHLFLRRMLDRFSDADFDHLTRLTKSRRVQDVLRKTSRDRAASLLTQLPLAQPGYLRFMPQGIGAAADLVGSIMFK